MGSAVWSVGVVSVFSLHGIRRRLPLVGAFCMLSLGLGLSNLDQSRSFVPLLRSKFSSQSQSQSHANTIRIKMEGSSNIVPSIVVYVTVPNRDAGKKLAESIVKEKLAACVNIVPGIESVYEWEGKIQRDSEELLIIKTRQSLLEAVIEHSTGNNLLAHNWWKYSVSAMAQEQHQGRLGRD
ncbi:protein CutA, chloroplastic-like isoform X2 [Euphorbia lathyris]|uniref:protein CutA, chloroplastic-like isoform X2 n=1 Tax=Euphorbia lathyris TaxID=212925 RepID=UPI003313398C